MEEVEDKAQNPKFERLGYKDQVLDIINSLELSSETDKSILKSRFLYEVLNYDARKLHTKKYYNVFRFIVTRNVKPRDPQGFQAPLMGLNAEELSVHQRRKNQGPNKITTGVGENAWMLGRDARSKPVRVEGIPAIKTLGQAWDMLRLTKLTKTEAINIKNVLNDQSRGVYQGKIFVKQEAQKTDAYQLSKALLLNDNAEFDAKPELEIYADDVKCSHGSTSGSIDLDSIHYLKSRGIPEKKAYQMLINGFLSEILEKLPEDNLKKFLMEKIGRQINGY